MTFENALKRIQTKFEDVDGSKLADMAVQVSLTDEDCGGTLYFKVTNGTVDVQGYDYRDNDAAIDIARKAFMDILAGKLTLDKAIEKGQATAKGDFEKLATLEAAIPKYVAPAKTEAAAAKAEPKAKETKTESAKAAPVKESVKETAAETKPEPKKAPKKKTSAGKKKKTAKKA